MRRLLLCGSAPLVLTWATIATERSWPSLLPLHLALFVTAGVAWCVALGLIARAPRGDSRGEKALIVLVAIALRVPAWWSAPAHSDDVYRYAWDGRVTRAGINPYLYAPADAALSSLRGGVFSQMVKYERTSARPTVDDGTLFARVNNADLPTIYPPLAQAVFFACAWLPLAPVTSLKIVFALCDLGTLLLLMRLLARRGDDPRFAIAWGWSPLVVIEVAGNAHVDALAIVLLVAALDAWQARRAWWAGVLLGAATAAKLVTAPLAVALRSGRTWLAMSLTIVALALPFVGAGARMAGSTGELARRWRANDGAYALVQAMSDKIVCAALHAPDVPREGSGPRCTAPLDIWPHRTLARLVTGRDYRDSIYPDELSSFLARAFCGLALAGVALWVLLRRKEALDGVEWTLGALLLFTPALHPWYALWLLPIVALRRRLAWAALAALVPLGYVPLAAWLAGGPWRDPVWTRVIEHGVCWSLLVIAWRRKRRSLRQPV